MGKEELLSKVATTVQPHQNAVKFLPVPKEVRNWEQASAVKRNAQEMEPDSLFDFVLMEVFVVAQREARRRGNGIEKSFSNFYQSSGRTMDKREWEGLARFLMLALFLPAVHQRLEQIFWQILEDSVDLAGHAHLLLEKIKRSVEAIVKEELFRS
jgi:hypothetical protein